MEPLIVPCLSDNFSYVLRCETTGATAVVDPSEFGPVAEALRSLGGRLDAIWCTHHHHDHVGGVEELRAQFGNVPVYGHASESERIPCLSKPLEDNATFTHGDHTVRVLHVPGHTSGALTFVVDGALIFTGDTLFLAGCGRLFEGTPPQMHTSVSRIAALPKTARLFTGHEYGEKNLRFAHSVEPGNKTVQERLAELTERRAKGGHGAGYTVEQELAVNPFLRVDAPEVQQFALARGAADKSPHAVFAALREARNTF